MNHADLAQEWFRIADSDLSSAEFLQDMQPIPCEIICYHCQQSAEKFLKGFLAFHGTEIPNTHDLLLLNKTCQKIDPNFLSIIEPCLLLTDYSVSVRYPYPIDITLEDVTIAIKNAGVIKDFVITRINEININQ